MSSLFFTCPTTHQQAPTGIETDVQSLRAAWRATLNVRCPHCGEVHQISVPRDIYQWRAETTDFAGPSRGASLDCAPSHNSERPILKLGIEIAAAL
jgi:hypothetical protein